MVQATETFALGGTQVTTVVEIDLNSVWLISGDFAGTIPSGEIGFINGNVNLTGDLIVEGLLTGIDTFTLEGNGFQILVQNGGVLNLQGIAKSGWVRFGETPTGWLTTDAIRVAPTQVDIFGPAIMSWTGTWGAHPATAPAVLLPNGVSIEPEVANLTRSINLKNLKRIHFHDDAGVATLKHLTVTSSGVTGVLAQYPIHFHLNGEASRGSLVEGVVTLSGKNHAYVAHASHGITFRDCIAYNTTGDAYWWDVPLDENHTANNSNDIVYDHCMAMTVTSVGTDHTLTAFMLGAGTGNQVFDSVATCVQGGSNASGFNWPEAANQNIGDRVWLTIRLTSHNNKSRGFFTWQNDAASHNIDDSILYRNGLSQVELGAYGTNYHFRRMVLMGGSESAFTLHSRNTGVVLEDTIADRPLRITKHVNPSTAFTVVRRCQFSVVNYTETQQSGVQPSWIRYEDCGWTPAKFALGGIVASSIIEITEAGVLTHRWAAGVWS